MLMGEEMLTDVKKLKRLSQGVSTAKDLLAIATATYDEQVELISNVLAEVKKRRKDDPDVQEATKDLEKLEADFVEAEVLAKQAVIDYWEEFGFSNGKKSITLEGCALRIRETTSREIVDPNTMVLAARENEVYDKVIRELRPILNRAAFNSWVDLMSPPGVEVTHAVTASVTILKEE